MKERLAFEREMQDLQAQGQTQQQQDPFPNPLAIPTEDPVPFADPPSPDQDCYWPVITSNAVGKTREVSYLAKDGSVVGSNGRRFMSPRKDNQGNVIRWHIAVDLLGNDRSPIVACEDGQVSKFINNFYLQTSAVMIRHAGVVILYAELTVLDEFKLPGAKVTGGQIIGFIKKHQTGAVCHFETWKTTPGIYQGWSAGSPRPANLLNPTKYLLALKERGKTAFQANYPEAIRLNMLLADSVGWIPYVDQVVQILGLTFTPTPGDPQFADAVAEWQRQHKLSVDGVLGKNTWMKMKQELQ